MVSKQKKGTPNFSKFLKETAISGLVQYLIPFIISIFFLVRITEMDTLDFRFKLRGEIPGDPRILLIDIDDQSTYLRPPWNLHQLEKLLMPIQKCQPAAIGIDLRFFGHPQNYEGDLQQFVNHINCDSIPIVLGIGVRDNQLLKPEIQTVPNNIHFGSVTIMDNYYPESDEVVRRIKLLSSIKGENQPIPSFALQILAVSRNMTAMEYLAELAAGGFTDSPADYHLIRYYNNYRHSRIEFNNVEKFAAMPVGKILEQSNSIDFLNELDRSIQDSTIVIIGATYQTPDEDEDWFQTPISSGKTVSGVVVHANILSWLLERRFVAEPGLFCYFLTAFVLILLTWLVIHFFKSKWVKLVLALAGLFLLYGIIVSLFFIIWEIWLPVIWPFRLTIIFLFILLIKKFYTYAKQGELI